MSDKEQKTLSFGAFTKYLALGIIAAFVVLWGVEKLTGQRTKVTFEQISVDDAKQLAQQGSQPGSGPVSYAAAVAAAAPGVVNIYTAKLVTERPRLFEDPLFRHFFDDRNTIVPRQRMETSLGSGVIISDSGYILTNNHVIEGADEIQVALRDGRNIDAKVIGVDPESDLAVLKVEMDNLPTITLGQSDHIQIGDVVLAIGNPFGVGQTVTMGIISATGRDRLGLSTFENFIQTDAAINPGNSGGALINAYGHLVGINTAIFSRSGGSQGIGFAIPINYAKDVTEQIIERGHVVRGWIGIEIQDITPELAESFGLERVQGVIVAGVLRKGPSDKAGLQPGDIILEIDNEDVSDSRKAVTLISRAAPGDTVKLKVLRDSDAHVVTITAGQRPLPGSTTR